MSSGHSTATTPATPHLRKHTLGLAARKKASLLLAVIAMLTTSVAVSVIVSGRGTFEKVAATILAVLAATAAWKMYRA